MKPILRVLVVLLGTLMAAEAVAQSGQGGWYWGGYRFDHNNTPGWALMTVKERNEFRREMKTVNTYDECIAVQAKYQKKMEERAEERNVAFHEPRSNACDRLKTKGAVKQ